MWCRSCQQDVPGVASLEDGNVHCARCLGELSDYESRQKPASAKAQQSAAPSPVRSAAEFELDNWRLEEDLDTADELIRQVAPGRTRRRPKPAAARQYRIDPPIHSAPRNKIQPQQPEKMKLVTSLLAWSLLSLGLMSSVFGGVLLGWAFFGARPELWQIGMPFAVAGQIALLLGLVFQLEGLWRSHRATNQSLEGLELQLQELRQATSLLSASHSRPAQSFYWHMADGASPQLLLADLKGQLDLLATKMSDS